ncbi:mariner Mos1 transposase [Trichonephila clavipes]|nr:mariner Mos1 transposase [Trichonephila clavipes]
MGLFDSLRGRKGCHVELNHYWRRNMGIPYHLGIKAIVDGKVVHILSRQDQRQTNAVNRKIMATVFWDRRGVLLVDFMPQGTTIFSDAYCATLRILRRALQNKRSGMLSKGVLLLYDNARPHTSRSTRELIESFDWEVLDHALYRPDPARSNLPLFRYLKQCFGGKRFSDNEEGKAALELLAVRQGGKLLCEAGFQNLVIRYNSIIYKLGNYVEK